MSYKVEVIEQSNGTLKIDGGELIKGKITVENGGRLEISQAEWSYIVFGPVYLYLRFDSISIFWCNILITCTMPFRLLKKIICDFT